MKTFPKQFFRLAVLPFLFCSCSSKFTCESCMEMDLPIEKTWELCTDLNSRINCPDNIDYFYWDEFKTGAIVTAKLKGRGIYIPMLLTEVEPYTNFSFEMKGFLFKATSFMTLEEITPAKTRIYSKTILHSPFVPFMRSKLLNLTEKHSLISEAYLEGAGIEFQECYFQCN